MTSNFLARVTHTHVYRTKIITNLFIFFELLVIDGSYLGKLSSIVRVFDGVFTIGVAGGGSCRGVGGRRLPATLLRPGNTFGNQHVVQAHQLWIWWLLFLGISQA